MACTKEELQRLLLLRSNQALLDMIIRIILYNHIFKSGYARAYPNYPFRFVITYLFSCIQIIMSLQNTYDSNELK